MSFEGSKWHVGSPHVPHANGGIYHERRAANVILALWSPLNSTHGSYRVDCVFNCCDTEITHKFMDISVNTMLIEFNKVLLGNIPDFNRTISPSSCKNRSVVRMPITTFGKDAKLKLQTKLHVL